MKLQTRLKTVLPGLPALKTCAIAACVFLTAWRLATAENAGPFEKTEPVPQSVPQWLAAVRSQLPREPTWIKAWLSTDGQPMLNLDVLLDMGATPPKARYSLSDAFGRDIKEIIIWRDAGKLGMRCRRGAELEDAPAPDLFAPIGNTAMSWGDMNLSFLWWENGIMTGLEEIRGRECVIIEVNAPENETGIYDHVRLWIDIHHRMLLQAEGYNLRGERVRRMQVRSFRKIDDEWMVKDIVVRRYPGVLRTHLRVRDMGIVGANTEGGN